MVAVMAAAGTGGGGREGGAAVVVSTAPTSSSSRFTTKTRRGGGGGGVMGLRRLLVVGTMATAVVTVSYRNLLNLERLMEGRGSSSTQTTKNSKAETRGGNQDDGTGGQRRRRGGGGGDTPATSLISNGTTFDSDGGGADLQHLRAHLPTTTTASSEPVSSPPPDELIKDDKGSSENAPSDKDMGNNEDDHCPFRYSKLYRRIYVYPSRGTDAYRGSILSEQARNAMAAAETEVLGPDDPLPIVKQPWPWIPFDVMALERQYLHYDLKYEFTQYSTEILIRELLTNPENCLRTDDPERALLFYVPHMPSLEEWARIEVAVNEHEQANGAVQSRYGTALLDAIVHHNYTGWESPDLFGLTSEYWKRNNGSDHILVYSEPMHGLSHELTWGSFHYINTQLQLHPPISVGIELSQTFVRMHPACARKNVLLPYPNPDGRWFNGQFDRQVRDVLVERCVMGADAPQTEHQQQVEQHGLATMYYNAGDRGECGHIRVAVREDYQACSTSYRDWHFNVTPQYRHGMRISTFCPAPIGDSPSAKRMFDILHAGCIPVVLITDFVWPLTTDMYGDGSHGGSGGLHPIMSPDDFSLRLETAEYGTSAYNHSTCHLRNASRVGLEDLLAAVPREQIQKWQSNLRRMSDLYSWYKRDPDLPDHPLREGRVPDGGLAHAFVRMLEERSDGSLWGECREELARQRQQPPLDEPTAFVC